MPNSRACRGSFFQRRMYEISSSARTGGLDLGLCLCGAGRRHGHDRSIYLRRRTFPLGKRKPSAHYLYEPA